MDSLSIEVIRNKKWGHQVSVPHILTKQEIRSILWDEPVYVAENVEELHSDDMFECALRLWSQMISFQLFVCDFIPVSGVQSIVENKNRLMNAITDAQKNSPYLENSEEKTVRRVGKRDDSVPEVSSFELLLESLRCLFMREDPKGEGQTVIAALEKLDSVPDPAAVQQSVNTTGFRERSRTFITDKSLDDTRANDKASADLKAYNEKERLKRLNMLKMLILTNDEYVKSMWIQVLRKPDKSKIKPIDPDAVLEAAMAKQAAEEAEREAAERAEAERLEAERIEEERLKKEAAEKAKAERKAKQISQANAELIESIIKDRDAERAKEAGKLIIVTPTQEIMKMDELQSESVCNGSILSLSTESPSPGRENSRKHELNYFWYNFKNIPVLRTEVISKQLIPNDYLEVEGISEVEYVIQRILSTVSLLSQHWAMQYSSGSKNQSYFLNSSFSAALLEYLIGFDPSVVDSNDWYYSLMRVFTGISYEINVSIATPVIQSRPSTGVSIPDDDQRKSVRLMPSIESFLRRASVSASGGRQSLILPTINLDQVGLEEDASIESSAESESIIHKDPPILVEDSDSEQGTVDLEEQSQASSLVLLMKSGLVSYSKSISLNQPKTNELDSAINTSEMCNYGLPPTRNTRLLTAPIVKPSNPEEKYFDYTDKHYFNALPSPQKVTTRASIPHKSNTNVSMLFPVPIAVELKPHKQRNVKELHKITINKNLPAELSQSTHEEDLDMDAYASVARLGEYESLTKSSDYYPGAAEKSIVNLEFGLDNDDIREFSTISSVSFSAHPRVPELPPPSTRRSFSKREIVVQQPQGPHQPTHVPANHKRERIAFPTKYVSLRGLDVQLEWNPNSGEIWLETSVPSFNNSNSLITVRVPFKELSFSTIRSTDAALLLTAFSADLDSLQSPSTSFRKNAHSELVVLKAKSVPGNYITALPAKQWQDLLIELEFSMLAAAVVTASQASHVNKRIQLKKFEKLEKIASIESECDHELMICNSFRSTSISSNQIYGRKPSLMAYTE